MKIKLKIIGFFITILLLILFIINFVYALQEEKVPKKIMDEAKKHSVRIVVELEKNKENALPNKIQKKIKKDFKKYGVVFLEANYSDLELISRIEGIKIREEKLFKISLFDSVPLINATMAWSSIESSINLSGFNQTICIIDTGINYTHPDLGGCFGNNNKSSNCKVIGGYDYVNNDEDPMDDHGHGTHVSGIAVANGYVKGVAKDSKIVALKALNSDGVGSEIGIISSINWCIENSEKFNIKVISMSIGDGQKYSSFCDDSFPSIAAAINEAVTKNISVVIASGNEYHTDGISAPACIQNAIPVASTTKQDIISSFSNRNYMVKLAAPGSSIYSTLISGSYGYSSGTSMATPHVAGAIAIINQYLEINRREMTPKDIESLLNNTGLKIYDSESNLNYSRINLFNALISIDINKPNVSLLSPLNLINIIKGNNVSLRCNASDLYLRDASIIVWNSSNDVSYLYSENLAGSFADIEKNVTLEEGKYKWNCFFTDLNNNINYYNTNFSFSIILLNVSLLTENRKSNKNITFFCGANSSDSLINVTFYIWNSSSQLIDRINKTISGKNNISSFQYNFTKEGVYYWNCLFSTEEYQGFAEENNSFEYDITSPLLNVSSPLNNSISGLLKINLTINEEGNCSYILDDSYFNFLGNGSTFIFENESIEEREHNISFLCYDTAGNMNQSEIINFSIDKERPIINLISPGDNYTLTSPANIEFYYNITSNKNINKCDLIINKEVIRSDLNITNTSNKMFEAYLNKGTYFWRINCTNNIGNTGSSEERMISISSSSSYSGGGSSSSQNNLNIGANSLLKEENKTILENKTAIISSRGDFFEIKVGDNIYFRFENNETHSIFFNGIESGDCIFVIRSEPIIIRIKEGEESTIDLNSSFKLVIRIIEVRNDSAKIYISAIKKEIKENQEIMKSPIDEEESNKFFRDEFDIGYIIIKAFILLCILIALEYLIKNLKKTKKEMKSKLK